ncbi:MAG: SusC/RagA family TonB-linked outer membrane protein [Bacteroidia bacterium]|nr:SusC/RagA family TonB-linked outer membrane protein [Bacteroidia bacterium]
MKRELTLRKVMSLRRMSFFLILGLMFSQIQATPTSYQGVVSGKITDPEGAPVVGAAVVVKGTSIGAISDLEGRYTVSVPNPETDSLLFSYIGFIPVTVAVNGQTELNFTFSKYSKLDEVVVVGYANKKRTEVTGSIATLKSENFNTGVITSPEQLLQAKVPGVRITSSSGEPGSAVNVTIRGAGSLRSGNSPLYVVDGIPLSNEAVTPGSGNVVGSNVGNSAAPKNPLNFLNPDDILSIDVLKDASATAIYGSRGSNGVILITTKKGSAGTQGVSYNGFLGTSTIARKIDLVGIDTGTDWQDEITRNGTSQSHNVSLSGGSGKASYRASLAYFDQEGIIKKSSLERFTGRINTTIYALPSDRLKLNVNLIASHVIDNGIPRSDVADTDGELITNTLAADPTRSVLDANGDYSSGPTNPVGLLDLWNDVTKTDRVLANVSASLEILKGLNYQLNLGLDRSNAAREQELLPNNLEGININNGSYNFGTIDATNFLIENFLTYDVATGKNSFNFLAGHGFQQFGFNSFNIALSDYQIPSITGLDDPGNATNVVGANGVSNPDGSREVNKLESVFGRVNYSFDNQILVSASLRADGSSKFGENNRWGYFPAVSVAYRLSEILSGDLFDDLKVRVGWGQTGNQEIPNKATQETFQVTENGISRVREANPDLKWEVSTQFNVGIDFNLLDSKLYGNIDYFNRVNSDPLLLVDSEPPAVSQQWVNLPGTITNQGVEIFVGTQLANTKDFSLNIDFNATFTTNVVEFDDGREIFTGVLSGRSINGTLTQIIRSGEGIGTFYLPTDNGDGSSTDREIQGSGIPNFVYGFNTYAKYKAFDLSFNLSGVSGNVIYNATDNFLANFGGNVSQRIANASTIPPGASSFFLESGAFLRINNATLGYNLPANSVSWLKGFRVYVTGQNLFVFTEYTGYDPEVSTPVAVGGNLSYGIDFASYPRARTFMLGLNFTL